MTTTIQGLNYRYSGILYDLIIPTKHATCLLSMMTFLRRDPIHDCYGKYCQQRRGLIILYEQLIDNAEGGGRFY